MGARSRILGAVLLTGLLAVGGYLLFLKRERNVAASVYSKARCLPPNAPELLSGQGEAWRYSLPLGKGEDVQLEARRAVGGRVALEGPGGRYRISIGYGDYIYPEVLKVSEDLHLAILSSGSAGGLEHEDWLTIVDLRQGQVVTEARLDTSTAQQLRDEAGCIAR
jgi:hypothetical protein